MSRWNNLPPSEQGQLHLSRAASALISAVPVDIRKNLTGLIFEEKNTDGSYLCYYKHSVIDSPITYLCTTGCCPNGCCALSEVKRNANFDLAIILLLIFVFAILFTAVTMFVIYYIYNRKSDDRRYAFRRSFTENSIVGSQASGPPSYLGGEHRYIPHINPVKLF